MRSIWNLELYSLCEKQILLNGNENSVLKDLNFVNTKGLEKNINSNELIKTGKSTGLSSSSPSLTKRKYENNENVKTPVEKKAKLEDIKSDIDTLLGEYAVNIRSVDELEITQTSSYFTCTNPMSPILNKVNFP
jgi:hypothetical protein